MTIQPEGERSRTAVRWIAARLRDEPGLSPLALAHEAIARFDLTPLEGERLLAFYREAGAAGPAPPD